MGLEEEGLYAAPAYLAARGVPRSPADLAGHELVLFDREFDRVPTQQWLRGVAPEARISVRANTTSLMHAACAAGSGIALLSTAFVAGDARFERVLPRLAAPSLELWTVTHADLRESARVAVTLRLIESLLRRPGFVPASR
jgi:DNA-binding transcriptional LysR family regulator